MLDFFHIIEIFNPIIVEYNDNYRAIKLKIETNVGNGPKFSNNKIKQRNNFFDVFSDRGSQKNNCALLRSTVNFFAILPYKKWY